MSGRQGSPLAELRDLVGWPFFVLAFAGRLPLAMNVVGVLTLVATVRGSIAEAGIASAVVGLSSGVGGPLLGAAADRWGQRGVLTLVAVVHSLALVGVTIACYAPVGLWAVLGACGLAGAASPQISPLTRVRWMSLHPLGNDDLASRKRLSAAMSYEGMADELSFVGGPILAGLLAALVAPAAPVLASAALTLIVVIAFAWHRTAAAGPGDAREKESSRRRDPEHTLLRSSVLLPVVGMVLMGGFFGAALVSLTAFLGERGSPEQTGLIFGCMGISSAIFAAGMSRLPERFPLVARWLFSSLVILAAAVAMSLVDSVWGMYAVFLIGGSAVGPLLVTLNTLGAAAAPARRFATTMIMLSSGITGGQAIASAVAGAAAEQGGFTAAVLTVLVSAGGAVVVSVVALLVGRRNRRRLAADDSRIEGAGES